MASAITFRKGGHTYGRPDYYAQQVMDPLLFHRVIAILQNPEVESAGIWEASLVRKLKEAGMEGTDEHVRWRLQGVLGWLCENDLVVVRYLQVGTAGIVGLFVKFADGVEINLPAQEPVEI